MISAVSATIALPLPDFVLAHPSIALPRDPIILGDVRPSFFYDERGFYICRLDIYNDKLKQQLGADFRVSGNNYQELRKNYLETLEPVRFVLHNDMNHYGWNAADIRTLAPAQRFSPPEWAL